MSVLECFVIASAANQIEAAAMNRAGCDLKNCLIEFLIAFVIGVRSFKMAERLPHSRIM